MPDLNSKDPTVIAPPAPALGAEQVVAAPGTGEFGTAKPKPQWRNLPPEDPWCAAEIAKIEPDLAALVRQDNIHMASGAIAGWRCVGASCRGKSHFHHGSHREDSLAFMQGGSFAVVCLADGIGTCRLSRMGSELACREVAQNLFAALEMRAKNQAEADSRQRLPWLTPEVGTAVVLDALDKACAFITEMATRASLPSQTFGTTLLLGILARVLDQDIFLATMVGDGGVWGLSRDGLVQRLARPNSGTMASEITAWLPDRDKALRSAKQNLVFQDASSYSCLLLCTDGVEDPFAYPTCDPPEPMTERIRPIFVQLYGGVREPHKGFKIQVEQPPILDAENPGAALEKWLSFEAHGEYDDRTAIVLHRHPFTIDPLALKLD